ncbi:MAG: hypothetical protein AB7N76_07505 [Planctomycetota bacterium]
MRRAAAVAGALVAMLLVLCALPLRPACGCGVCDPVFVALARGVQDYGVRRCGGWQSRAIWSLKTIASAQALFREGDREVDGILDYGTLAELGAASLIDSTLASGQREGYRFRAGPGSQPLYAWWAIAEPIHPCPGLRSFYVDQGGVIYGTCERRGGVFPLGQ